MKSLNFDLILVEGEYADPYKEWDEKKEEIEAIFNDAFSDYNIYTFSFEETARGLGANIEVILASVSLPLTVVGGIPGLISLGKSLIKLKKRWREKAGAIVLFPENVAILLPLAKLFSGNELERIVYVKSIKIGNEGENVRLGDFPSYFSYIIVTEPENEYMPGEIHHILVSDNGDIVSYTKIKEEMWIYFSVGKGCLTNFVTGR